MARFPIAPFTKGLNTLVDPAAGDPQASPQLSDVRGHTGILTLRKGYRVLDIEPSDSGKAVGYLGFDGVNDYATNAAWTQVFGDKFTIRLWATALTLTGINNTDGERVLFYAATATGSPVKISIIGATAGGTTQIKAHINYVAADPFGGLILTGTARTAADWITRLGQHGVSMIRLVKDGATATLYVGEQQEATGTLGLTITNILGTPTSLWVGSDQAGTNNAHMRLFGLTVINRALSEADSYWGIGYPTDVLAEADILGHWPLIERSGTTLKDYSSYQDDLTISGATWTGTKHYTARGLGIFSWRRANGDIYHTLGCTRRATGPASADPSGVVYSWKASTNFLPFYFGGTLNNSDSTAGLTGMSPYARMSFAQGRDMLILSNGVDYCRKYQSAYKYLGGTAPPTAPVLVDGSSGADTSTTVWTYAYSYYNPTEGTETGLSPSASVTITDKPTKSVAVTVFHTSDSQFTKVRIYRSQTGDPALYLLTEVLQGAIPYTDTKTDTDLRAGPLCAGSDVAGNRGRKRAYLAFPEFPSNPTLYFTPRGNVTRTNPVGSSRGPGSAPSVADGAAGSVNAGLHYWAYSYYDSVNDVETGMSPATGLTSAGGTLVAVTTLVLPPEGSRYDQMRLYRTKAGATIWYLAQTFNAAVSVNETQADAALTTTIETRSLPPRFQGTTVFANRLWGFYGPTLYWSTAGAFEDHPESNGFAPKSGVDITAINATDGALFVHFKDGTIHLLPHPGDEPDLGYFVPLNLKQWSPLGAAVGHFTTQAVPGGVIWLAKDGFYFANAEVLENISRGLSPSFLNLNAARGAYACSLYDSSRRIYRCWLSRGNSRLNDECFVYYLDDRSWWLDYIHADAAGVLYDATEVPHYCFMVENGVLMELDESLDYDGDGSGTLTATTAGNTLVGFTDMASRTAPTGGDGGYPIVMLKSDGTSVTRTKLDPSLDVRADADSLELFYPSSVATITGTWAANFHGIRGYIKTMLLHLGDLRHPKNVIALFFYNRVQSAGGLQVNMAADEGTLTAVNQDVALTKPVSQVTPAYGSGRVFQLEIYSDPPAASRPWGLKGLEIDAEMDMTDAGS